MFDLRALKPGDEVGIESTSGGRTSQGATAIRAIYDDGVFELESGDWFDQEGKCLWNPESRRLVEPTDEGRAASLHESLWSDFSLLSIHAQSLPLDRLRELRETVLGLLTETA